MDLRSVLAGRRVLIVRHGNTTKADVDAERELTDRGRLQCEQFRTTWAKELEGVRNLLVSPAKRTVQTGVLLAEALGLTALPLEDLYFLQPWRTELMRTADHDLGYAPISAYIQKYANAHQAAGEHQAAALASYGAKLETGDVMLIGHAVYLSFLALHVVEAFAPPEGSPEREPWLEASKNVVLDTNVGEVCAFDVSASGVRYLLNPEATDFAVATSNASFVMEATG